MNLFFIIFAILPEGTVVNETVFFTFLSILIGLIIIAFILRKRAVTDDTRNNNNNNNIK
jgi:hypothetical protein